MTLNKFKYNVLCIWLTRLRLGLSPLKQHQFQNNFIVDPNCKHCINTPETTEHFFFKCLKYTEARLSIAI